MRKLKMTHNSRAELCAEDNLKLLYTVWLKDGETGKIVAIIRDEEPYGYPWESNQSVAIPFSIISLRDDTVKGIKIVYKDSEKKPLIIKTGGDELRVLYQRPVNKLAQELCDNFWSEKVEIYALNSIPEPKEIIV